MDRTIRISPDGRQVTFLYFDDNPVMKIGEAEIIRASNVRWDKGKWKIFQRLPNGSEIELPKSFERRSDAIQYEVLFLERELDHRMYEERLERLFIMDIEKAESKC